MISYIITFLIFSWLIVLVINQIKSTKRFNIEVNSMSVSLDKVALSRELPNIIEILENPESFEHRLKEKLKTKTQRIFTSLSDVQINPANFDLVHKRIKRFFVVPYHKHETSNLYIHVLKGSLDIFVEDCTNKDSRLGVKKVSLKKEQSFYIPASCHHKLFSRWGADVVFLFIPSLSYVESKRIP